MNVVIPDEVYEVAARAYANELVTSPRLSHWLSDQAPLRAAIESAFAAGRAQSAADIRASIPGIAEHVWNASAPYEREICAQLAEGAAASSGDEPK